MMNEQMIAHGAVIANQELAKMLQMLAPLFKQAEEIIQKKMPPPPQDPQVVASLQIAKMETDRKAMLDKATIGLKEVETKAREAERAADQRLKEMEAQAKQQQQMFEQGLAKMEADSVSQTEALKQQVEIIKNDADNRQHQLTEITKNNQDNQTAILIKRLEMMQTQVEGAAAKAEAAPAAVNDTMGPLMEALTKQLTGLAESHVGLAEKVQKVTGKDVTMMERIRDKNGKLTGVRKHHPDGTTTEVPIG